MITPITGVLLGKCLGSIIAYTYYGLKDLARRWVAEPAKPSELIGPNILFFDKSFIQNLKLQ
jgi:hypothetical protein